ncbi:MAG: hypothetical protein ACRDBP_17470 [Luteolibacter sp.]
MSSNDCQASVVDIWASSLAIVGALNGWWAFLNKKQDSLDGW